MKTSELRIKVKKAIKDFGLNINDVSVSVRQSGYSDRIDVRAKHDKIDFKGLQSVLNNFKRLDIEQGTGEILLGGNTYVFIYHPDGYTKNWLINC